MIALALVFRMRCSARQAAGADSPYATARCTADPGPPRTVTVPGLQRSIWLRFVLRRARDTRRERTK
jgi:hypothetical protein